MQEERNTNNKVSDNTDPISTLTLPLAFSDLRIE